MSAVVNICPIWNDAQFFDNAGKPLNGGQIFVFDENFDLTTTYTNNNGDVENTNPIVLDSNGRLTTSIWLIAGTKNSLQLADMDGNVLRSVNNVITPRIIAGDGIVITGDGTGLTNIAAPGAAAVITNNELGISYEYWLSMPITFNNTFVDAYDWLQKLPDPIPVYPEVEITLNDVQNVLTFNKPGSYAITVNTRLNPNTTGNGANWPSGVTAFGVEILNTSHTRDSWVSKSYHTRYGDGNGDNLPEPAQNVTWTDYFTVSVNTSDWCVLRFYANNPDNPDTTALGSASVIINRIGEQYNFDYPGD